MESGRQVSFRPCRLRERPRSKKKVLMAFLAFSTSPQGSRFLINVSQSDGVKLIVDNLKSIPVSGVPVGGSSREASDMMNSKLRFF